MEQVLQRAQIVLARARLLCIDFTDTRCSDGVCNKGSDADFVGSTSNALDDKAQEGCSRGGPTESSEKIDCEENRRYVCQQTEAEPSDRTSTEPHLQRRLSRCLEKRMGSVEDALQNLASGQRRFGLLAPLLNISAIGWS